MKTISQSYHIDAPVEEVWGALVKPDVIKEWSGKPADMDETIGKDFSLWGGDIHGTNTDVDINHKLVQDWYAGSWSEPSKVTFTLTAENDGTRLELLHENVPDDEYKDIDEGWHEYYIGALQQYLESKTE